MEQMAVEELAGKASMAQQVYDRFRANFTWKAGPKSHISYTKPCCALAVEPVWAVIMSVVETSCLVLAVAPAVAMEVALPMTSGSSNPDLGEDTMAGSSAPTGNTILTC